MAVDKVTIWNMAIGLLGGVDDDDIIQSEDSTSKAAKWCRQFWEQTVEYVASLGGFREFHEYAELSDDSSITEKSDWDYAYALPAGCIKFLYWTDEDDNTARYYEWERFGRHLLSDLDECYIKYVRRPLDTEIPTWTPEFRDAVATNLASRIAVPLGGNVALKNDLRNEFFALALPMSEGADGDDEEETTWITDVQ